MINENEFFREITLRICGNLRIEEGLRDCLEYLAPHIPADALYLQRYEPDVGAMRLVVCATTEKGEHVSIQIFEVRQRASPWLSGGR